MTALWRRRVAVAMLAGVVVAFSTARAGDDEASDEADLLEFIGSWEGDDYDWLEILDAQDRQRIQDRDSDDRAPRADDDDGYQ